MAISHVQLLLVLITSLLFLPALRAVNFEYCNKSGYDFGNITRVDVSPDPIMPQDEEINITIFGYARKSIHSGFINLYGKLKDNSIELIAGDELCEIGEACSITAGTSFVLPVARAPYNIKWGYYKYIVSVDDEDEEIKNTEESIVKMCIEFNLPISSHTLLSA